MIQANKINVEKSCENCGKPESDQVLCEESPNGANERWCLDCMRLSGYCVSCGKNIRLLVEDYYMYDEDECPDCLKIKP